mmetsp:Transcript_9397/g.19175  ORF Transcript_9397/g.19175 Transcript_9397/m.19175 type:complete len:268 (-) Transcript_9397:24-827(-)
MSRSMRSYSVCSSSAASFFPFFPFFPFPFFFFNFATIARSMMPLARFWMTVEASERILSAAASKARTSARALASSSAVEALASTLSKCSWSSLSSADSFSNFSVMSSIIACFSPISVSYASILALSSVSYLFLRLRRAFSESAFLAHMFLIVSSSLSVSTLSSSQRVAWAARAFPTFSVAVCSMLATSTSLFRVSSCSSTRSLEMVCPSMATSLSFSARWNSRLLWRLSRSFSASFCFSVSSRRVLLLAASSSTVVERRRNVIPARS